MWPSSCVTPAGTSTGLTSRINGMATHRHTRRINVVVVVVVVFTLKAVPVSTQYFLTPVLVQLTRTPSNSMFTRLGTDYEIRNQWFFAILEAMTTN